MQGLRTFLIAAALFTLMVGGAVARVCGACHGEGTPRGGVTALVAEDCCPGESAEECERCNAQSERSLMPARGESDAPVAALAIEQACCTGRQPVLNAPRVAVLPGPDPGGFERPRVCVWVM